MRSRQSLGSGLGGRVSSDPRDIVAELDARIRRCEELEALNREYVERCERAEDELARLRVNRSHFGELLMDLDALCRMKLDAVPAQMFRRDPSLPGSSTMAWCAWLAGHEDDRAYGRSGEAALKALVEALGAK